MIQLRASVLDRIVRETALDHRGVAPPEILSEARSRRIAHARHDAMARLRAMTGDAGKPLFSLPEIGRAFHRDHTTVLASLRQHARRTQPKATAGGQDTQSLTGRYNGATNLRLMST